MALSAITGMCAVAGSSASMRRAATPLMPGRLMSIRMTSGMGGVSLVVRQR